jgi:hypothetical protein
MYKCFCLLTGLVEWTIVLQNRCFRFKLISSPPAQKLFSSGGAVFLTQSVMSHLIKIDCLSKNYLL